MPPPPQAPRPKTPASEIRPRFIWPTPEKANLLFWVEKTGFLPKNKDAQWAYGDPWRDTTEYPDHILVHVTPQDERGMSRWYYANNRTLEDNYNFEFTQSDIGGQAFHGVRRTFLTRRADFDPAAPVAGAAMPRDPDDKFPAGYVLSGRRQQRTGDDIFDNLYVVEIREYVLKVTITSIGTDEINGGALSTTETLYYATELVGSTGLTASALFAASTNAYWGVQTDGTRNTGRQLSAEWYEITSEQLVSGTAGGGVVDMGSYITNEDYFWPPVLSNWEFMDWVRNDGGVDIYPRYDFDPDGYRGPCKTSISRKWKSTPHTIPDVIPMLPTPIIYSCPFYRLAIPACLHLAVSPQCDIGTEDPVYDQNVLSTRTVPRTNYTNWPAGIVGDDYQNPHKGGYLRFTKTYTMPVNTDQ